MKAKKYLCIIFSVILAVVCSFPTSYAVDETIESEYADGQLIFKYEQPLQLNSSTDESENIADELNDAGVTDFEILDAVVEEEPTFLTSSVADEETIDDGMYLAEIDGDVQKICKELEKIDGIEYAEPNYLMTLDSFTMPTDTKTSTYKNYCKWYFDYMQITEAWTQFESTGSGVTVAVIDNGYDTSYIDFSTHLWDDGNGHCGYNGADESYDISLITDDSGAVISSGLHGSNVAGIIGMAANGIAGVGAAYDSELMLLKCAEYSSTSTSKYTIRLSSLVNCINFAVNNGADIITMSLSASGTVPSSIKTAINNAVSNDIAVFASAGNNAAATTTTYYPACMSNVIGVMAIGTYVKDTTVSKGFRIESTDQLSDFSNYDTTGTNQYYDVAAPGVAIVGCGTNGQATVSSGTSQATPLVAACAALYRSAYPDETVDQVYEALRNSPTRYVTTNSTVTTSTYNYKVVDAYELLNYPNTRPIPDPEIETSDLAVDPFNFYISGLEEGFDDITDYITIENGTSLFTPSENGNGTGSTLTIYDARGNEFATYTIIVYGDINGDSFADGQDAVLISSIIDSPDIYSTAQGCAANVNFDNSVNEDDYMIVANYAIGLDIVTQS